MTLSLLSEKILFIMKIIIQQAITAHQEGKFEEAEQLYRSVLKNEPTNFVVRNNLGVLLRSLGKFDEAEASYKKAIELKPDYIDAHNNLGNVLKELGKFDEAEASYKKAIELKPDYIEANNNLGVLQLSLSKLNDAEASYKKAIELKPDYEDALLNLNTLLQEKNLISNIFETRRSMKKNKINSIDSRVGLTSNPFITHRDVETKLLKDLYKGDFKKLDETKKNDARYGNGKCSDFKFFKNDLLIVKNIEADLINIMKQAVKSDIYIHDSFLNIYGAGSGTTPHQHINLFDKKQRLVNQKYGLTYYLSVGDQNCSEPGNLQLYNPSEEIKLTEGMVVIIPAYRKHSAVYNGRKDRIMIGVNFYSLI